MIKYVVKRFLQMLIVLLAVSLLVFLITLFIGDPVSMIVSERATEAEIQAAREYLGIDKPIYVQYSLFLKNLLHGNFGKSYIYSQPAMGLILERLPATLEIVLVASALILLIGIPFGVYAGAYPKKKTSRCIMVGSIFGISLPSFWLGMMFIYLFAVILGWLPASGRGDAMQVLGVRTSLFVPGGWRYIIMPATTLAVSYIAQTLRLTRAGVIENMKQDYVKFARAKGVSSRNVLFGHALKNALIPVITVFGLNVGNMIVFTTVTETIFAWPGMGKLLVDSINKADRPVIVAYLMVTACMFVIINFVVDMIYTFIDPRIELR